MLSVSHSMFLCIICYYRNNHILEWEHFTPETSHKWCGGIIHNYYSNKGFLMLFLHMKAEYRQNAC